MKKGKKIFCHPRKSVNKTMSNRWENGTKGSHKFWSSLQRVEDNGWNVEVSKSYKGRILSWVHNVDSIWRLLSSWGWNGIRISHWDEDRMEWGGLIICEGEDAGDEEQRVWRWLIVCGLLTGWLPLLRLRPTHDDDYAKMMVMMMVMMIMQRRWWL